MIKIEKPKKWFIKYKGKRHLTPDAKSYLSFKLKQYWHQKKAEEEISEIPRRDKTPIRIILNVQTQDDYGNMLYLEVMIECYSYQYNNAVDFAYKKTAQKFGKQIADSLVVGVDYPKKISNFQLKGNDYTERYILAYRHNLREKWQYMK